MKPRIVFIILLFFTNSLNAAVPLIMNDSMDISTIRGEYMDYFLDKENKFTISEVASPSFNSRFISGKTDDIVSNKEDNTVTNWTRVTVKIDSKTKKHYVVELFDFNISQFEMYIPLPNGKFEVYKGGSEFPFFDREYVHKNFVYDFHYEPGEYKTIYFKIKSNHGVSFIGTIRSVQEFTWYATYEYFLLALFYGIIAAMALYNLFLFVSLRDKTYIFYVLYVLSIAVYSLSKDGLGFQFLWYNHPSWNSYITTIANYYIIIFALLYARSFLNTFSIHKLIDNGIVVLITLRTLVFFIWIVYPEFDYSIWLDLIPLLLIYNAGIYSWYCGSKVARFYVLAFTLFFIGFFFSVLQIVGIIKANIYTVYSLNFGILSEMIVLSLALADRIKMLTYEKEKAQQEMVIQFKEKEMLKDNLNKDLEEKVKERTIELEQKNKELDNFVYRSSHDIKGPLKSIIGLTTIALKDIKDPDSRNYFEHILKSSKRLDSVVHHLLTLTAVKEAKLDISEIDIEKLINDIVSDFQHYSDSKSVKIEVTIQKKSVFYSNEKLVYSILQNMIENGIKYRDPEKENSFFKIRAEIHPKNVSMEFEDNGLGIDAVSQEKIFDMFYKVNPESSGSGIGLSMVKTYVEKLQGTLKLESEVGKGTKFTVQLKNHVNSFV